MADLQPQWIVGKVVASVDLNPFPDGKGGTAHEPRIEFDDGSSIAFITEETETGGYGTAVIYRKPPRRPTEAALQARLHRLPKTIRRF